MVLIRVLRSGCGCSGGCFWREGRTYGYKITQDVRGVLDVSGVYFVSGAQRLQKDDCLEVYDMAYAGRNRR